MFIISEQNVQNLYPFSDQNGSKTLPFGAAHTYIYFFQAGTITNPTIWLVLSAVRIFLSLTTVIVTLARFFSVSFFSFESLEKMNKLFTGLGLVRIVKNCDLGLEYAALGLRHRAAFPRPRSQIFTIRTSQSANNIYICVLLFSWVAGFLWKPAQLKFQSYGGARHKATNTKNIFLSCDI